MAKKTDVLFSTIESWQGDHPWGRILDAGTGDHSLGWIVDLPSAGWTAVTGDMDRAIRMQKAWVKKMRACDAIVAGNWLEDGFLSGERYDVVIADYLLGAIDGFAPYFQDRLFERLRPHVKGRLYLVGLEPYPQDPTTEGGRLVLEIARLRDACILLAGHRCYREYPLSWVTRKLVGAGFVVERSKSFGIRYRKRFVRSQLAVCRRKLPHFASRALARQMESHIDEVERRGVRLLEESGAIPFGEDYVVMARPDSSSSSG